MSREFEEIGSKSNIGIFHPIGFIDNKLEQIAGENRMGQWGVPGQNLDQVAYFMASAIYSNAVTENGARFTPFEGLSGLHLPGRLLAMPVDILRFGCATEMSISKEFELYEQLGIKVASHNTVDLFSIPLRRIRRIHSDRTFAIEADALSLPYRDKSFDLLVSDQILGSSPRENELNLLSELRRVSKDKSSLVMQVFAGVSMKDFNPNIGLGYYQTLVERYGKKGKREGYTELTQNQWKYLGRRLSRFLASSYGKYEYAEVNEVTEIISKAGLHVEECVKFRDGDLSSNPNTGFFAIHAIK